MNLSYLKPSHLRLRLAGLTAAAGGIVSVAMVLFGGSTARFLPTGDGFHVAAVLGAGLAGLALAPTFGRPGWIGWIIAAIGAVGATLIGAMAGSTLIGLAFGQITFTGFGLVAIVGAAENPVAVLIWGLTMAALHVEAGRVRQRLAISP